MPSNNEYHRAYYQRRVRKDPEYRNAKLEASRRWRTNNPEKKAAMAKRWRQNNPLTWTVIRKLSKYKRRGALGSHTAKEWEELKALYRGCCLACGMQEPFAHLGYPHLTEDHVIPITKGGTNYIENIQPLCLRCNSTKGTQTTDYRIN